MTSTMGFCASCGVPRVPDAKFCPSCGTAYQAPTASKAAERKKRRSSPLATALLAVLVLVGGLYLLNNTAAGLTIKCHVFGDYGACLLESFTQPGPIEDILEDVGNSV